METISEDACGVLSEGMSGPVGATSGWPFVDWVNGVGRGGIGGSQSGEGRVNVCAALDSRPGIGVHSVVQHLVR